MARWHWLDVVIAPLRWLERARGWRRVALLAAYLVVALVGGGSVVREAALWRIPDCPEPFDLARYGHVDLPDADNAAILYAEAIRRLTPGVHGSDAVGQFGRLPGWEAVAPEARAWAEANAPALDVFLAATSRPDALFVQPGDAGRPQRLTFQELRPLIYLTMLAASRREEAGDLAGAWTDHAAMIRAAIHLQRHAGIHPASFGAGVLQQAVGQARIWADAPEITADLLRRAARDLTACRSLLPEPGDLVRVDYFASRDRLEQWRGRLTVGNDPLDTSEWAIVRRIAGLGRHLFSNEPKQSLRIFRLLTLGRLAQLDRPEADRPPPISAPYAVYPIDDRTPAPLRRIRPETLAALAHESGCGEVVNSLSFGLGAIRAARDRFDGLMLQVAERAYALDHGGTVARTYADLMPTYLGVLPDGIAPGDLLAAP